jgi:hypothetical protein
MRVDDLEEMARRRLLAGASSLADLTPGLVG